MNILDADYFAYFLLDRGCLSEVPDFLPKDGTYYVTYDSDIKTIPSDIERIRFLGQFNPSCNRNKLDWSEFQWNQVKYIHVGWYCFYNLQHVIFSGNFSS